MSVGHQHRSAHWPPFPWSVPTATSPLTYVRAQLTNDPAVWVVEQISGHKGHIPAGIHSRLCLSPITQRDALPSRPALPRQGRGTVLLQSVPLSWVTPAHGVTHLGGSLCYLHTCVPAYLLTLELIPRAIPSLTSLAWLLSPPQASTVPPKQQQHPATCRQCSGLTPLDLSAA